jgi:glycosyltransferase involved in cell wall biosynthesis
MKLRLTFYGVIIFVLAMGLHMMCALALLLLKLISNDSLISSFQTILENTLLVTISGLFLGVIMVLVELLWIKKDNRIVQNNPVSSDEKLTVVLTAYNDELSIQEAVRDFQAHPRVQRVIVISNNSSDRTMEFAKETGAIVYNETLQGYGACVFRALTEGLNQTDTTLTLLCEGDCTFRAHDIEKFLAYLPHADIVNGSRIVEQLRTGGSQLTTFMYYGNFFVGKLLEFKHVEQGTLTDVGTTYKLCRNNALQQLLPHLSPKVNLEFNPYLLDTALEMKMKIVECPITFYPRVGASKGGNRNNIVALNLGLRMMFGLIISWKPLSAK